MESRENSANQTGLVRDTLVTFQNMLHFSKWVRIDLFEDRVVYAFETWC
jgi:hypothetical protein